MNPNQSKPRYTLPSDINTVVGKKCLRYSLCTGYVREAERCARKLTVTLESFISTGKKTQLKSYEISQKLASRWQNLDTKQKSN
jgi:hypothetical protein